MLLVPAIAVTVGVALTYGQTRFRAAAEPSLAVLAAVGVLAGHRRASERRHQEPRRHGETAYRSTCVAMSVPGSVVPALIPFHVSSPVGLDVGGAGPADVVDVLLAADLHDERRRERGGHHLVTGAASWRAPG